MGFDGGWLTIEAGAVTFKKFVHHGAEMKTAPRGGRHCEVGAGSRNRTHDQRFTKPLLYQLSYAGA